MGLADRLKAYQAEQAARQAAEAEAARKAQQESERQIHLSEEGRRFIEQQTREVKLQSLAPLLEILNTKKQLEELCKYWGLSAKSIDEYPSLDTDETIVKQGIRFGVLSLISNYTTISTWDGKEKVLEYSEEYRNKEFLILARREPFPSFSSQGFDWENRPWVPLNPHDSVSSRKSLENYLFNLVPTLASPKAIIQRESDSVQEYRRKEAEHKKWLKRW